MGKEKTKKKIIIHVGLHKTGTTFLQKEVFPNIRGINYLHKPYTIVGDELTLLDNRINLISGEGFSGFPIRPHYNYKDVRFSITDRIKALFPDAKIIICTSKNKEAWLKSLWKEYITSYSGVLTYKEWKAKINPAYIDQESYVKYLQEKFSDVLVFDYSEFIEMQEATIKKICEFIGVPVPQYKNRIIRRSLTDAQVNALRKINVITSYFPKKVRIVANLFLKGFFERIRNAYYL